MQLITPDWPDIPKVKAFTTTRNGGVSEGKFDSLNMGDHVGDDATSVLKNRQRLPVPNEPTWLKQVHGVGSVNLGPVPLEEPVADASYTSHANKVCVVMTADCLPILIAHKQAKQVFAIHAGWRGLAAGIIENAAPYMTDTADNYQAWLGPAISVNAFEVGAEVKQAFSQYPAAFKPSKNPGRYMLDLYHVAGKKMNSLGLSEVYGGEYCTYQDPLTFFSYRRDGQTGRMATCIWIGE